MFGGFPKLFDRSFFIGFFLPAFLLSTGAGTNLLVFGYIDSKFIDVLNEKSTLGAALSLVLIWLLAILLVAFNRPIIRLLEGYGDANPFRFMKPWQQQKFRRNAEPHLRKMANVLDARRHGLPEMEVFQRLSVWHATLDFPEEVNLVLPTRLGNVMRAYERYSDVVYGIEAIVFWPRLFMIIPEEARDQIRESEGLFHFSVNMLFSSVITLLMSGTMMASSLYHNGLSSLPDTLSWQIILVLAASIFFGWFCWWHLPDAARQRGEQVKSAFDLYRRPLAETLGFELPATEAEERRMWQLLSRRFMLRVSEVRLPGYAKSLDDFRTKDRNDVVNRNSVQSKLKREADRGEPANEAEKQEVV